MTFLFVIQLVSSFVVGGVVIALLSFLAERVSSRISGIILAFPSTVVLGFFFLGWAQSPEAVAKVIPATLIPLGLSVLFPVIYVFTASASIKFFHQKIFQIGFSFLLSVTVWLLLALPMAMLKLSNLFIGIAGYLALAIFSHFMLQRKDYIKPPFLSYSPGQKIGRAVFVGLMIAMVVFIAETLNPFWGGVFAMFPAAFSSSLVVLHWYYNPESLFPTVRKVAVGSISIFMYAITVMFVFPLFGFIWGTLIAFLVSFITTLVLSKIQPGKNLQRKVNKF